MDHAKFGVQYPIFQTNPIALEICWLWWTASSVKVLYLLTVGNIVELQRLYCNDAMQQKVILKHSPCQDFRYGRAD